MTHIKSKAIHKLIGQNVKYYRQCADLTQQQLANAVNKSVSTITNVERGTHTTTIVNIFNIAQVLNVPVISFLEGEDDIVLNKVKRFKILSEGK